MKQNMIQRLSSHFGSLNKNADVPTIEDYKKAQEELKKARRKIAEQTKALKGVKKETPQSKNQEDPRETFKALLAEERFFEKNPDAESYRKQILQFRSQ